MKVTVYCGSNPGLNPQFTQAAKELGHWIGRKGYTLVYGGGSNGLMGTVADATLETNGDIHGVIPEVLKGIEVKHPLVEKIDIVDTMPERKTRMIELGDVFIALPGGVGTLEEISEILSLTRIGLINKPTVFYNIDGYYDSMQVLLNRMVEEDFLKQEIRDMFLFSDSLENIDIFIHSH